MTIAELGVRGKATLEGLPSHVWLVLVLILASTASFGLGLLAGRDMGQGSGSPSQGGFSITQNPLTTAADPTQASTTSMLAGGQVVASKTGSVYYLPWCSGAQKITDANKIWFANRESAEVAGYQPAGNCKGL